MLILPMLVRTAKSAPVARVINAKAIRLNRSDGSFGRDNLRYDDNALTKHRLPRGKVEQNREQRQ